MMLQALIEYAERKNLGDSDFETVSVHWLIPLDSKGRLAGGPISLSVEGSGKKPKPKSIVRPFTSANELNQGTKSHFLCDTLERAALFLDPKAAAKAGARAIQHGYFKSLLAQAAGACPGESAKFHALLHFLEDSEQMRDLHLKLTEARAKPSESAIFSVDGTILLDQPEVQSFWRGRRAELRASRKKGVNRVCLATGLLSETLDTTEKIKGVPGGLATGTNLISFDKDSFCSFGLEQAQNAALSPAAELKIRSALRTLVETSRTQRLVFNETIHLHWTRAGSEDDPIDLLTAPDPQAVEHLIKSLQNGIFDSDMDPDDYYCLSLSGNGARIIVRDWLESTVPEIKRHIAEWFQDLALIQPDGSAVRANFNFGALLYGLVRADLSELPPQIPTQLFHAALRGRPLPRAALAAAVRRQQLSDDKLYPARLALIKACLNRNQSDKMTETLDPSSKDRAYLCGQLFAVIGRLQLLALGQIGASIAERTYGGVATRPATTFGPVFTRLPAYLKKANSRFPGSGTNQQKEIESLCQRLDSLGGIPKTLGLEDQGRFALGYYCQLAKYRTDRTEAQAAEQAEKITPEPDLFNV